MKGITMSVFVIKNKKYDTEKMDYIGKVQKWYKNELASKVFGGERGSTYYCEMYRSKKGNYLITRQDDFTLYGEAITETEAKSLLIKSDLSKYEELFGEVEEA